MQASRHTHAISGYPRQTHAERRRAGHYRLEVVLERRAIAGRWREMARDGAILPIHADSWLDAWSATYGSAADATPLFVTLVDTRHNRDVIGLPLVRRLVGGRRVIEFVSAGLAHRNGPLIGALAPQDEPGAERLWRVIVSDLPAADILRLANMPARMDGAVNPLALLAAARPSSTTVGPVRIDDPRSDWRAGLASTFREELRHAESLFEARPGARFARVRSISEARRVLAELESLDARRSAQDHAHNAFHGALLERGLGAGEVILTALKIGETIAAAMIGVAHADHYAMLRLAAHEQEWNGCALQGLLVERTMKSLHADGFRIFDVPGDDACLFDFGASREPLYEIEKALGWAGLPGVARAKARRLIAARPGLAAAVKRLRRVQPRL